MLGCVVPPTILGATAGPVVEGDRRGRALGFPTANLDLTGAAAALENGVYAGIVEIGSARWPAAVNVGTRPTVDDSGRRLLEAHLLDFAGDLYGMQVTVHLLTRLRAERRFDSLAALVAQLRSDVAHVRALLASTSAGSPAR